MKRFVAAVVAFLFLSTATLHVFAHVGEVHGDCAVCQVQQAGVVVAAAPCVAAAALVAIEVPPLPALRALPARTFAVPSRGPPSASA
ncbi:MAG: hypothetical protein KGL74_06200 [Elusimicrobia bacterium]|nr:hypothetical protein [Elusimicrobiota bacterium]MDE2510696.1 hypothetical protein [Elusimicrobiota bacterium]